MGSELSLRDCRSAFFDIDLLSGLLALAQLLAPLKEAGAENASTVLRTAALLMSRRVSCRQQPKTRFKFLFQCTSIGEIYSLSV